MKQMLIQIMTDMMPFMKPLVWLAGLAFLGGLVLVFAGGRGWRKGALAAGWIVLAIGIFFLAAQGMGALLGAAPSINFADGRKMEFFLVPFWQLGLSALAGYTILRILARITRPWK